MMGFTAMLLRLVGQHPDQVKEQEKFKESLGELDEREKELDELLEDIQDVDDTMKEKAEALATTADSLRPDADEREEPELREEPAGV